MSQRTQKNGKKELQSHCEEVYTDKEETNEIQEDGIQYFERKESGSSQWKDELLKSQLTWCCRPGPR